MNSPLLKVDNITMKFGSLYANKNVTFHVNEGEIVSLIGPNGAGKTTLFNCLTGFYKPFAGKVYFDGKDITGLRPHKICGYGLTRTFQIVKTLKEMTVKENIITAAFHNTNKYSEAEEIANEVMELTGIKDKADILGGNLTIADKKRVEIARVMATKPKMIMLDEAMAGLNQTEIKEAMDICIKLRDRGITLLIVEHIMEAIMPISDRIVVLNAGQKIAEGKPDDIINNEDVIKAYLGERYHAKSKRN